MMHLKSSHSLRIIGCYLKKERERSGLTQKEVAKELGYSSSQFVSNWERGLAEPPIEALTAMMALYNLDLRELVSLFTLQHTKLLMRFCGLQSIELNIHIDHIEKHDKDEIKAAEKYIRRRPSRTTFL